MKVWFSSHFALMVAFAAIIWLEFDRSACLFFSLGAALSFANIGILYFSWKRILAKKTVALAVTAIVLKYGITGYLIYKVAKLGLYPLGWTAGGLGLFLLSTLSMASVSTKWQFDKATAEHT
jgi:hypothetical protein